MMTRHVMPGPFGLRAIRRGRFGFAPLAVLAAGAVACSPGLSPPFTAMKDQAMTVYRLQNVEPPPSQAAGTPALQLPPQVQQWITAGASLLPPGLLPPGLLPGSAPPQPAAADVPRFHNFRIVAYQQVNDASVKSDILDTFGHSSNFQNLSQTCMLPEFGFALAQPNAPPADILVSLSCQQVQAYNIQWPYPQTGLTSNAETKIVSIAKRVFGG
jgi:hypothetical protein